MKCPVCNQEYIMTNIGVRCRCNDIMSGAEKLRDPRVLSTKLLLIQRRMDAIEERIDMLERHTGANGYLVPEKTQEALKEELRHRHFKGEHIDG